MIHTIPADEEDRHVEDVNCPCDPDIEETLDDLVGTYVSHRPVNFDHDRPARPGDIVTANARCQ